MSNGTGVGPKIRNLGPKIVVIGNEKGGSGKSTTALHLAVALMKQGFSVGTVDLDARQGTLSRAIENRTAYAAEWNVKLAIPEHWRVHASKAEAVSAAAEENEAKLKTALAALWQKDYVVIDTPGSDSQLSRLGHSYADVLITPMNDSFLDLDLLGSFDSEGQKILSPSVYSQMVWEQRQRRAAMRRPAIDWVVMRNRLSHVDSRNRRDVGKLLEILAKRIGFRLAPGFGERVIFRELFPVGLTLLDMREDGMDIRMSMSHIAARQELRNLLQAIGLTDESGHTESCAATGTA